MKTVLKLMLSLTMVFSSLVCPQILNAQENNEAAGFDIYPKPQSVEQLGDDVKLDGTVDVIVHGEQDKATLPKLEAILKAEKIDYEIKNELGDNAAIIIATDCKECSICDGLTDSAGALSQSQGYVLKVENTKNPKGQVKIVGADEDGVYYGVMTLKQLFAQKSSDGAIASINVSDYPDVKFRGYVEGFYGIPWTHEDRAELFEDTTNYKMTTYIYAPKDDPYHRSSWRSLYPEKEAGELSELCEIAEANNMEFCWTIHPGADYNYTTDSNGDGKSDDFEILLEKLDQVYSFGVRQFGIFYDDLDYGVANGSRHAQVINDAYAYLKNKYGDVKPMITVVTRYTNAWGASWNGYFTPFMQQVNADTLVLWTGQSTMSAITKDYMEYPKTMTGIQRDFGVWWNYPVNDYSNSNMLMASLDCLDKDVDNIATFFLNPMSEADASRVAIYSGADYAWNVGDFDSYNSWLRAIDELVPEANEAFARFADNISHIDQGNGFYFDESKYLKADMERFKNATSETIGAEVSNMKAKFEQMLSDVDELRKIKDAKLYDEIQYHLNAYKNVAEAGLAAMTAYEAALNGDLGICLKETPKINAKLEEARTHKIPILNGEAQVAVGSLRILPFIREQAAKISQLLNENTAAKQDAEFITNTAVAKEVSFVNNAYVFEEVEASMKINDYVGIKLPKVMNVANVKANISSPTAFKLQYSLNGIVWYDMPTTINENELASDLIVTTAYLRAVCVENVEAVIHSFSVGQLVKVKQETVNATVSTNMQTYQNYVIANAMDGSMSTWFWSSHGSENGSYVSVNLNKTTTLDEVVLYSGINKEGVVDGYPSTQLEVSNDGAQWNAVGEPLSITAYQNVDSEKKKLVFDANGVSARYFRFKSLASGESWSKVYEITYTEGTSVDTIGTNVQTNMNVTAGNADSIYDQSNTSSATFAPTAEKDYVQIDLGTLTPLYDVAVYFGNNKGFAETKLLTSANGTSWKDGTSVAQTSYTTSGSHSVANFASSGNLVRYIRFEEVQATSNDIQIYEVTYNQTLSISGTPTVSTNMSAYGTDRISNALDHNMNSKFYSNAGGSVGDYIQVDFGKEVAIFDTCIHYGGNPNVAGNVDGFIETQLQVSNDGQTWTNIGEPLPSTGYAFNVDKYAASFKTGGVSTRYLRFTATEASDNWVQVYEIEFNGGMDSNNVRYADEASDGIVEFYPNETYINGSTINIAHSNLLDDGNINSAATITNVVAGNALIYPMSVITDVQSISFLQDANAISNATIKVLNMNGEWEEVGVFDEAFKEVVVNAQTLAVQLEFDGSITEPQIYEIMVKALSDYQPADYTAVDTAIANVPSDLSIYTEDSVANLNAAIAAVVRGLDVSAQSRVDAMAQAIVDATNALVRKPAVVAPEKVTTLNVEQDSYKDVTLTWGAVEGATAYDVYRKAYKEDSVFTLVKTVEDTTLSVSGLMTGKEYSFYVVAKNEAGVSENSDVVAIATQLEGKPTLAIEKVSKTKFTLSWSEIDGATRYIIYRKRGNDPWKKVLTLGAEDSTYTTSELPAGDYKFIVKAGRYDSKDRVMTGSSNTVEATSTYTRPSVTLTAGSKQIKVAWKAIEGVKYYQVYRATSQNGKYTLLKTTTATSFTAKSLTSGKQYYFKVRGYKSYNNGEETYKVYTAYSSVKSAIAK